MAKLCQPIQKMLSVSVQSTIWRIFPLKTQCAHNLTVRSGVIKLQPSTKKLKKLPKLQALTIGVAEIQTIQMEWTLTSNTQSSMVAQIL